MAKIALVFLFAFCVFQISTAARIPREVEAKDAQKEIEKTMVQFQEFFEKTFTKDNFEKFGENLKQIGDQIAARGKELVQQADAGIKKLQEEEKKQ